MNTLSTYLLAAITYWLGPTATQATLDRAASVASDVAEVVSDPKEPAIFGKGAPMDGLLLSSLAVMEGGISEYVDTGKCNDPVWRKNNPKTLSAGDCDGGRAYSLWQIHPGSGLVLLESKGYVPLSRGRDAEGQLVKAVDLKRDRKVAARTALHMVRDSVEKTGGLCGYTGESGKCPKAQVRLDRAKSYFASHPYDGT